MRWTPGNRRNIDDRRGRSGAGMRVGAPLGIGGLLVVLLFSWITGVDVLSRNALSVRMELQANCFAGVWGHAANRRGRAEQGRVELDPGDFEEGINAAAAIGDDRIQRQTTGHVSPDRFTHGSSEQRVAWFRRGFESGSPDACNTFRAGT